jgi:hypothetical protein
LRADELLPGVVDARERSIAVLLRVAAVVADDEVEAARTPGIDPGGVQRRVARANDDEETPAARTCEGTGHGAIRTRGVSADVKLTHCDG